MTINRYVRCGQRTVRTPCKYCNNRHGLYWGHDRDNPIGPGACEKCGNDKGKWVLVNRTGELHDCRNNEKKANPEETEKMPKPSPFDPWEIDRSPFADGGRKEYFDFGNKPDAPGGKGSWEIELRGVPFNGKIGVIKEIRNYVPGLGLKESKELVEAAAKAPVKVPHAFDKEACDRFMRALSDLDVDARMLPYGQKEDPVPSNSKVKVNITTKTESEDPRLEALKTLLAPAVDEGKIREIVADIVDATMFPTKTVVVQEATGAKKEIEGATHHKLADVISSLSAGEHVLMVGPAGTGKSTIAEQAAEALGFKSYSISLSPQTPASQLLGYMQAAGEYIRSLFREAYEHGGVFHFDEMDNGHPSVLAVMNSALANGHMAFPDGMVQRHADFRAVASANTYGRGATRQYVGRQALDAATLDRFTIEEIDIDEALENELCRSSGLESGQVERVLVYVRKVRANVEKHALPIVVSPRASMGMCRLLKAGRSWEGAVVARVRRGLGDTEWKKIAP